MYVRVVARRKCMLCGEYDSGITMDSPPLLFELTPCISKHRDLTIYLKMMALSSLNTLASLSNSTFIWHRGRFISSTPFYHRKKKLSCYTRLCWQMGFSVPLCFRCLHSYRTRYVHLYSTKDLHTAVLRNFFWCLALFLLYSYVIHQMHELVLWLLYCLRLFILYLYAIFPQFTFVMLLLVPFIQEFSYPYFCPNSSCLFTHLHLFLVPAVSVSYSSHLCLSSHLTLSPIRFIHA